MKLQIHFLLLILAFSFITNKAHAWEIPGVPQQPQWFMPIMFEDATGQRDTIYLGYDSTSTAHLTGFDANFETWKNLDTSKFNVYIHQAGFSPELVKYVKVVGNYIPNYSIRFVKGVYPIKMKWVDSLMYSYRLPYPEIEAGRPRARIDMACEYTGEPGYFPCGIGFDMPPYILSDYDHPDFNSEAWYPPYGLVHSDSIYFEGSGLYLAQNPHFSSDIRLTLRPHNDPLSVNVKEIDPRQFKIYPNPFENDIYLTNKTNILSKYSIYNVLGRKLQTGILKENSNRIKMGDHPPGIYYIIIHHENNHFTQKLLKL
ncbi:MAG: T9SS C-terminal target domain-containing protein [Chitinophagaceae bacterium]|nr:MAG: T9SS C-terminal target domain-containing protein [Chitinophagaceae bacterium]